MFKVRSLLLVLGILTIYFTCNVGELRAQQDPQFTQYMNNVLFYNPAIAGKGGGYNFSLLHRSQWQGYSGTNGSAPTTQLMTASGSYNKFGFGIHVINDVVSVFSNQEVNLSASYSKNVSSGNLRFGLSGGMFSSTIKFDELFLVNPDPGVPQGGRETSINLNIGAGVFYEGRNLYVGMSSRHINEPSFDFGEGIRINQLKNHSYLLLGYTIRPLALISIDPSILIKSVGLYTLSYDVSVIATHNEKISAGIGYRGQESVSLIIGYSLLRDKSLRLGYSFDLVISGQPAKSPTSQEFMLTYNLPKVSKEYQRVIQRSPRFRY
jgi:type IX secretion system PorP/SprF family membrane protein